MASKGQLTGMIGTFLVAAQLSARGLVASVTSRGAAGADVLVTDGECRTAFSIQVKTNRKPAPYWLLGQKQPTKSGPNHYFAFVNLRTNQAGDVSADYYLVPARTVRRIAIRGESSTWNPYAIKRAKIEKYRDAWAALTG